MIYINLNLRNPWSHTFNNLWASAYATWFKNKFIELEVYQSSSLLAFMFNWSYRQSHAGLDIELGLLGYCVRFNFYDNRHWNIAEGRWMRYNEELGEH